jgi:hypothetical protein
MSLVVTQVVHFFINFFPLCQIFFSFLLGVFILEDKLNLIFQRISYKVGVARILITVKVPGIENASLP